MFNFRSSRDTSPAVEALRPFFSSPRIVRIYRAIAVLAVTRPEAIATLEVLVKRMESHRPIKSIGVSQAAIRIRRFGGER